MGQPARNHGGTRGHGYRGEVGGKPDAKMWASVNKYKKLLPTGSAGVGVELVTVEEFEKRREAWPDYGLPGVEGGLSDQKGGNVILYFIIYRYFLKASLTGHIN